MARLINANLIVLAIIGILLLSGANKNVVAQCQGEIQGLITECAEYVLKTLPKVHPSHECCKVVRNADFTCVCQHVTNKILKLVDIDKVIFVAQSCGNPIPSGTSCGGVTVP